MSFQHTSPKFGFIDLDNTLGLQVALDKLGFDPGNLDGIDGPKTRDAVKGFQERADLTADGIAGPKTKGALLDALAAGSADEEAAT
jgi:peptidoglycan hydrolase-like protein with peptidoglycan-binding domain